MTAAADVRPAAGAPGVTRGRWWTSRPFGYALLAALAFVPPLLTAPGKVAADTKSYLYLDPDRMLGRAASMWDANIGLGTVTHQNIGYLFPMGPFYWLFEHLGLPDWVAQRLWLGSLVFAAATGVLYLCRTLGLRGGGVVVAALAYGFSPYSLHYAARISVILLPWAALGWMLALVIRALRDGGWRYPALFAITVQIVGGVNATALLFAGLAPALWIIWEVFGTRDVGWRRAASVVLRTGALTVVTSLWWIVGLSIQGGYGIDILRYTETVEAVSRTSTPNEVLRGLGYWFFYGGDRLGAWIEASTNYTQRPAIILIGYGLAALALLAAGCLRWKHRGFFVLLALVGVVLAVGAHPYDDPTPFGALWKAFTTKSTAGFALRSSGRAIPLVVLGLAMLFGRGVDASVARLRRVQRPRLAFALPVVVGGLVLANFPALWDGTYYGENLQRDEDLPEYWDEAAAWLDAQPHDTRVLELPGADFASYRWGNTVDPVTPGLVDRPYVARELIPYGTPAGADLLNAFDRRIQEGVEHPGGFAALLRRMAVATVLARYDIQHERYNLVRPEELQRVLGSEPGGLVAGSTFGDRVAGDAPRFQVDERDLTAPPDEPETPGLAAFDVEDAWPIVRAESARRPLLLAGDGEGLVDAADAGLLDAAGVVRYSASLGADELRAAAGDDGILVVTDQNRKRGRRWSTVLDNTGYTEQAGEEPLAEDLSDQRLDVFPDASDDAFTVTEQRGVHSVRGSSYGNPISFTPEDRAARGFDGDVTTAWRTAAFSDAYGERLRLELAEPITTDHVNFVQPQRGPRERWITEVRLTFDDDEHLDLALDESSRVPKGQTLEFGSRTFSTLDIEITALNVGHRPHHSGASAVGFAEVRLRDDGADADVRVDEVVRMPLDLLDGLGGSSLDHPLVFTMTRARGRAIPPRADEERAIVRSFTLPTARSFHLTGEARLTAEGPSAELDQLLGTPEVAGSGWLAGCVQCRPAAARDLDETTAWNTPLDDVRGQWIEFERRGATTFESMDLAIVADGRHSMPTRLRIEAGGEAREVELPAVEDGDEENATAAAAVTFAPLSGRTVRVTILDVREVRAPNFFYDDPLLLPAGIAEVAVDHPIAGPGGPRPRADLSGECRTDLLEIDGEPVPVRLVGGTETAAAMGPLSVEPCGRRGVGGRGGLQLDAGEHVVRAVPGIATGIQLDRLVLGSDTGGGPLTLEDGRVAGLDGTPPDAPHVEVVADGRTHKEVRVTGATEPFWLVLGQSHSPGWSASVEGGESLGEPQLVDGYANGWLVDPGDQDALTITLAWTPQRSVWLALAVSAAGMALAAAIAIVTWRRRRAASVAAPDDAAAEVDWPFVARGNASPRWSLVVGPLVALAVAGVIVAPWAGVLVGAFVFAALRWPRTRVVLAVGGPVLLGIAGCYVAGRQVFGSPPPIFEWPTFTPIARPLGWLAIVLPAADVWVEWLRARPARASDRYASPPNPDVQPESTAGGRP